MFNKQYTQLSLTNAAFFGIDVGNVDIDLVLKRLDTPVKIEEFSSLDCNEEDIDSVLDFEWMKK